MSYMIQAGEFKHPILIVRTTMKRNADNIPVEVEEEIFKCRAKINSYKSDESFIAGGNVYREIKKFWFRIARNNLIQPNDLIIYLGDRYEIKSINNIQEQGSYYEVRAERKS
ncbi:head-tail adaptor protein [Clostridioides difficile]